MNRFIWASALGLAALWATSPARAQNLPCDCNMNGSVVINELISGVNILLGNAQLSSCSEADVDSSGTVGVNELVQCVNCANGCCPGQCVSPTPGGPTPTPTGTSMCGNHTTDPGEECDDGNNFGGDGCAANCTNEAARIGTFDPAKTIATVQTEGFPVIINLTGSQTFQVGKPRDVDVPTANGTIKAHELPVVIKATDLHFDPVRVTGLVCACVRGVAVPNLFGPGVSASGSVGCEDGVLQDISYRLIQDHNTNPGDAGNRIGPPMGTPDDPECNDQTTLPGGTMSNACKEGQDPNGPYAACANKPGQEETHPHIGICNGPRVLTRSGGAAPAGSAFIFNNTAIGLLQDRGTCKTNARMPNGQCEFPDYGPDCMPCTDDDLEQGVAENIPTTTGTAEAAVMDANNSESVQGIPGASVRIDKDADCLGECKTVVTGSVFDCNKILTDVNGGLSGGSLAVAFPSIDAKTIGDNVTTTTFSNAAQ